jgi:hypothetical protein
MTTLTRRYAGGDTAHSHAPKRPKEAAAREDRRRPKSREETPEGACCNLSVAAQGRRGGAGRLETP